MTLTIERQGVSEDAVSFSVQESPKNGLCYPGAYQGFIDSQPAVRQAYLAIEAYQPHDPLSPTVKERILQGFIWVEDPKNLRVIAQTTGKSETTLQATILDGFDTYDYHYEKIEEIQARIENEERLKAVVAAGFPRNQFTIHDVPTLVKIQLPLILAGREKELTTLALSGYSSAQIAQLAGITKGSTETFLSHTRIKIEKGILQPIGIIAIKQDDPHYKTIDKRIYTGKFDAVTLFGVKRYVFKSALNRLRKELHIKNYTLLNKGYRTASMVASDLGITVKRVLAKIARGEIAAFKENGMWYIPPQKPEADKTELFNS